MKNRLLRIIWVLSLLACPFTHVAVATCYNRLSNRSIAVPAWVPPVVVWLFLVHLVISVVASIAVIWLFRSWRARLLAWAAVAAILPLAFYIWWGALMSVSGSAL
jgi:hypothetical protein